MLTAKPLSVLKTKLFRPQFSASRLYYASSAYLSCLLTLSVCIVLAIQSGPAIMTAAPTLLSTQWSPDAGQFGILPMIYGSLAVMLIAMSLALPIGIFAAAAIRNISNPKVRRIIKSALEVLAGIPSIVYGLIGVSYLSVWIAKGLDLQSGRLILTAGLILAIMILPTILTLTEDAFSNVPVAYIENAASLGLYPSEVFKDVLLPIAKTDIVSAALLALGRALGETMAVMLVIGSLDRLPDPLYNILSSGQTMTSKLGRELGESAFGSTHFSALVLLGLILVSTTLILTLASHYVLRRSNA